MDSYSGTLTVTNSTTGCTSIGYTFSVIILPLPTVTSDPVPGASYCSGTVVSGFSFTSNPAGGTFTWTCTPDIGFGTSGIGNIPAFTFSNVTGIPVTATLSVRANNGCQGPWTDYSIILNPSPDASVSANYCSIPGYIVLTTLLLPGPNITYQWYDNNNPIIGATTNSTTVNVAGLYSVVVTNTTYPCSTTAYLTVATELVTDGSFTNYNAASPSFFSEYTQHQAFYTGGTTGLQPEGRYAVATSAYSAYPGLPDGYHPEFHGRDHTNNAPGPRNYMMINGSTNLIGAPPHLRTIWQQTISLQPNTQYYFSALGMNLNPGSPARLQFEIETTQNGIQQVGSIADLNIAPKPTTEAQVAISNWVRFYSTPFWISPTGATSAIIRIINLNTVAGGNDFGLDDISFGTLSFVPTGVAPVATGDGGGPVCEGGTLNLSANITGGTPPYTFLWTGPAGAAGFPTTEQNPTIPNVTTDYSGTYTLTFTDGYGCGPIILTLNVTVNPTVAAPVFTLGPSSTRCQGAGTFTYDATSTNSTGITYTLDAASLTGGNTIVAATGVVTYAAGWTGTSIITATATGCNGPATSTHTVIITPSVGTPVFLLGATSSRCQGPGTVIYTANEINTTGITYTLDPASLIFGNTIVAATGAVTYLAGWSGTSKITASAAGCNGPKTATHTVTIIPAPVAPSSASADPPSYCSNKIPKEIIFDVPDGSGSTLYWYSDACYTSVIGTGHNFHLLTPPTVTTTYYASWATPGCGSSLCASVIVTVLPLPIKPISVSASNADYCASDPPSTITLTATGGSGTKLTWYTGGCGIMPSVGNTNGMPLTIPAPLTTTTYFARWENGCGNSLCESITVNVLEPTLFTVTGGGGYCSGGSGVSIGLNGSKIGVNYQLRRGVTPIITIAGDGNPINFGNQTIGGMYTVVATMISSPFCSRQMGSVRVQEFTTTLYNVTGGGAYCAGGAGVTISLSGSQKYYNYQLWMGGNTIGAPLAGTGGILIFGPQQFLDGVYTIIATRNVAPYCTATMNGSATVNVNPTTTPVVTGPANICIGTSGSIYSTVAGMVSYTWNVTAGGTVTGGSGTNQITVNWNTPGPQTVTVTVSNGLCTGVSAPYNVTVYAQPAAFVIPDQQIYSGESIIIGGAAVAGNTYSWTSVPPGFTSTESNPMVSPLVTTTYTLIETVTATGCTNTHSVTITVTDHLVISKICSIVPMKPGDPIQYTITYSNLNIGVNAANVVIQDILPPAPLFTYVSSSETPSSVSGGIITWNSSTIPALANLPVGSYTITVNGICGSLGNPNWPTYDHGSYYIMNGGGTQTLSNNASISNATNATPIYISAPVTTNINQTCGVDLQPDAVLGYIKSATPSYTYYVFTATNTGNITDYFTFSILANQPPSTENLAFTILTLAGVPLTQTDWLHPGETFTFLVQVACLTGTMPNKYNISYLKAESFVCGTTDQSTLETYTYGGNISGDECDLLITKTSSANPVTVGTNYSYTLTVSNNGNPASDVVVQDILPASLIWISSTFFTSVAGASVNLAFNAATNTVTGIFQHPIKNQLNNGENFQVIITVQPKCDAYPLVQNYAKVTTTTQDLNYNNNEVNLSTNVTSIIPAPGVAPAAPVICSGSTSTLTASGALAGYDYRWYDAAMGGTLLYTGNPFTSPVLTATTMYFIAIYNTTTPACESSRTPVTVNVFTVPVVTADPVNFTLCEGGNATFSITATGTAPVSYKWQVNTGSGFSDIANGGVYSGATTNTLTITGATNSMNGYIYQCLVRSGTCGFISSVSAMLTVNPLPTTSLIYHQ